VTRFSPRYGLIKCLYSSGIAEVSYGDNNLSACPLQGLELSLRVHISGNLKTVYYTGVVFYRERGIAFRNIGELAISSRPVIIEV